MTIPEKPLVIPVFIPHSGCPHRCAFCNQSVITGEKSALPDKKTINTITDTYLAFKGNRETVELAFFGGNFLGLDAGYVSELLGYGSDLKAEKKIDGVRFSTRPDTITTHALDLLKNFPVTTVELGVQSMDDQVLQLSKRGHTSQDSINAARMLKQGGFKTGIQMMAGLPGEKRATAIESAEKIVTLAPDFVRIYPLLVLKGSLVEKWYRQGEFTPLDLETSVSRVKELYTLFAAHGIPVIRMGLQASEMLQDASTITAGPWHPAFGHLVLSELTFDRIKAQVTEKWEENHRGSRIVIKLHPAMESQARGMKNDNIRRLEKAFPGMTVTLRKDAAMEKEAMDISVGT